jgi:hypothetical protein
LDDNYQTYVNRVIRLTLPETYQSQLQSIQTSIKFRPSAPGEPRLPTEFPGYTIVTPPYGDDDASTDLYESLALCQETLLKQLPEGLLTPVPPSSFHLTLADLIWDGDYRSAIADDPDFERKLRQYVDQSFEQYRQMKLRGQVIRWQVLGLLVMPRAIAVCLAPREETAYEWIVQLRRLIYQNPSLVALGIEQQYHFTGHITLGYFGDVPSALEQGSPEAAAFAHPLADTLTQINQQWQEQAKELHIQRVELRKFDDMTRYYREPDWPVLEF